jgi:hypothetical protein
MRQTCQNLPLGEKAVAQVRVVRSGPQELHGHSVRYFAIHALGQVNGAHATAPQEVSQPVGSAWQTFRVELVEGAPRNQADISC